MIVGIMMTDEQQDIDNVVDFSEMIAHRRSQSSLTIKPSTQGISRLSCRHVHKIIDADERYVECADCRAIIDPIEAIISLIPELQAKDDASEVLRLKQYIAALEHQLKVKKFYERRHLLTTEEKDMKVYELMAHHEKTGHPPVKIKLTAKYAECYCGIGWARCTEPDLDRRIVTAQRMRP